MKGRTLGLLVAAGAVLASYAGASVIAVHPMSASLRNGTGDRKPRNSTKDPRFFLREASSCGSVAPGAHTLQAGESIDIGSPGFPGPYSTNLYLQWVLSATSSDDLTISCNIQGIKGWRRCKKGDKLIVRDGCRRRRLCPKLPKQYFKVTCRNTATITFRTNGAGELGGFCCTVTANVPETTTTEGSTQTEAPPSPPPQTPSPPPPNSCPCGVPNRGTRIVGGEETEMNEYPWLVALSIAGSSNPPFCGGSVYNSEWVVTSAYCIYGSSAYELEILYNMWDWTDSSVTQVVTRSVAEIIMHPQSDYLKIDNDIALIRVSSAVDLTLPGIMPVCLPSSTDNYADQIGIVTGWGTLTYYGSLTNKSKEVKVPIRSQAECASSLSANYNTSIMICAGLGNDNACQVDWGGPLTVDVNGQHHLAGIVTQDIGCAPSRPYGVFTNVPYYVAFIENNANTGTFC